MPNINIGSFFMEYPVQSVPLKLKLGQALFFCSSRQFALLELHFNNTQTHIIDDWLFCFSVKAQASAISVLTCACAILALFLLLSLFCASTALAMAMANIEVLTATYTILTRTKVHLVLWSFRSHGGVIAKSNGLIKIQLESSYYPTSISGVIAY